MATTTISSFKKLLARSYLYLFIASASSTHCTKALCNQDTNIVRCVMLYFPRNILLMLEMCLSSCHIVGEVCTTLMCYFGTSNSTHFYNCQQSSLTPQLLFPTLFISFRTQPRLRRIPPSAVSSRFTQIKTETPSLYQTYTFYVYHTSHLPTLSSPLRSLSPQPVNRPSWSCACSR